MDAEKSATTAEGTSLGRPNTDLNTDSNTDQNTDQTTDQNTDQNTDQHTDGSNTPATVSPASNEEVAKAISTAHRLLIVGSIAIVVFIGSLDSSIVSTLNPTLVAEFNSGKDYGWYGAAFLLVVGATLPLMGKLTSVFQPKTVFLSSLVILEVGCLICALARNSPTFIVGRAFAGLGDAGVLSSGLTITARISPLQHRAMYTSIVGGLEGVATIVGPTIGGALVNTIGWRWGFWINLPAGGVLFAILVFFFHPPSQKPSDSQAAQKTTWQKLRELDFIGAIAIMGSLVSLLLALQWGGTTYPWSNGRIIALLVIFGVSFGLVGVYESRLGNAAIFPTRLLRDKAFVAVILFGFTISSGMWAILYYLPTWFQAVQRVSAGEAGIRLVPLTIAEVVASTVTGVGTSYVGYLPPFVIAATVLSSIGTGLLYTLYPGSPEGQWLGYQIICGAGFGIAIQQSIVNAQAIVADDDVGYAISAVLLGNIVGGSVVIGISQALFASEVLTLVGRFPGIGADTLLNHFRTLDEVLSPQDLEVAVQTYNTALNKVFLLALILCSISALSWPFIPWKSLKSEAKAPEKTESSSSVPISESEIEAATPNP
ncbi:putative major facilitator superfamily transporter [Rosellinia necatrix]|uniref:Putative major facilitator superfamily transporter n=1 Tax=Rosellinia necatrix TaxID=77044 RepID=A0A1W2TG53_ROSNE|nr:putative major facilitator superfamily transporter [Rosellinia necatrix]